MWQFVLGQHGMSRALGCRGVGQNLPTWADTDSDGCPLFQSLTVLEKKTISGSQFCRELV